MLESKKIDILMQENAGLRAEITALIKNIHNCLFSFIASLGLFVGILINLDRKALNFDYNAGILAFLISQVGIIIIFLAVNIQVDVLAKAAYISYLEKKINGLLGETIIFWESKITSRQHKKGAYITSQLTLFLSYFLSFSFLTIYSFNKMHDWLLLLVQLVEVIILVILLVQVNQEFNSVRRYIAKLDPKLDPN